MIPLDSSILLRAARCDFAVYYAEASERDAERLDYLILTRAAYVHGLNASRERLNLARRRRLELDTDANERGFLAMRESVRHCATFLELPGLERAKIESAIFEVEVPEHES